MGEGFPGTPLHIQDLLVVGAADVVTGNRWKNSGFHSTLGLPHVYGPGANVIGVDGDKAHWGSDTIGRAYKITRGTSVGKPSPSPRPLFRHF